VKVNANEVKLKGVSLFESLLKKFDELIINVRGKEKYVVLDIERYKEFRMNELDIAYMKTMQDIEDKKYKVQSAKEHTQELLNEL
jgi:bifunctional DNA-binding transcriptional regulator/antitoxin component of YhaV-PrlF toxin-antitoxin module